MVWIRYGTVILGGLRSQFLEQLSRTLGAVIRQVLLLPHRLLCLRSFWWRCSVRKDVPIFNIFITGCNDGLESVVIRFLTSTHVFASLLWRPIFINDSKKRHRVSTKRHAKFCLHSHFPALRPEDVHKPKIDVGDKQTKSSESLRKYHD